MAETIKFPVLFGEWSLGTDTCLMWIGGFNDGFEQPPQNCQWQACPETYMPQPFDSDFDRSAKVLGPFGGGWPAITNIHEGQCVYDSTSFTDEQVQQLAECVAQTQEKYLAGSFFINAKTEQMNPKWDYLKASDKGWFTQAGK